MRTFPIRFKDIKYFLLILFLLISLEAPLWAANWYVSQAGAGMRNGMSVSDAWKGIASIAWDSMKAGDTLYIVGVLHGDTTMVIKTGGTTNNYFTIAGYDSKSGVVLGVEKNHRLWSGPDEYGVYSLSYDATIQGMIEWDTSDGPLLNIKLNNRGCLPNQTWMPGDYYYDKPNRKVYWKPVDEKAAGKTVTFNATLGISINGVDWVKIDGLKHYITRYVIGKIAKADHIWLNNLTIINSDSTAIAVNPKRNIIGSDYGKITNCTISDALNGIYFMSSGDSYNNDYWTIDKNIITDIKGDPDSHCVGIQGGTGNVISNNDLSYANTGITMWSGKNTVMNNNTIRYNHIHNMESSRGDGRSQGIGWEGTNTTAASMAGNAVYYNVVHDCAGDGIRPKFIDSSNYVYNNTVRNCNPNFYFQGVSASNGIGGIIKNNLSLDPKGNHWTISTYNNGIYSGLTLNNNLYYPDTGAKFSFKGKSYNFLNWKMQLNSAGVVGYDNESFCQEPLVSNTSNRYSSASDFMLLSASPAIDKGDNTAWSGKSNIFDYTGSIKIADDSGSVVASGGIVDIGAYEK